MRQFATTRLAARLWMLAAALFCAALCGPAALAQHGGGPGGGGPGGGGGMGGGGMGSPRMGGMGSSNMGREGGTRNFNVPTRPTGPQLGLAGRWWDERKTIKTLNLRTDQKQRMDEIFASNKGTLVAMLGNLQHEEDALSSMSKKDRQDETKVFAAISRVETARVELAKEIAHMQLQIRQQLDTDQVTKLDAEIASQR